MSLRNFPLSLPEALGRAGALNRLLDIAGDAHSKASR